MLTITKEELCKIHSQVCEAFLDVVETSNKLSRVGSKRDFNDELTLMVFLELLNDLRVPSEFFENDYVSILSNRDIYKIQNKALQVRAHLKRLTH